MPQSNPYPLSGRVAVVTGGGRGTGEAIARELAQLGAKVVVAGRTEHDVEAVAASIREGGYRAKGAVCDVSDAASVDAMARLATETYGYVEILVNNAGVAMSAPLEKTRLEDWQRLFAVNVTGTFLCTKAFLPHMVQHRWGRVINIASIASLRGDRYISAYAASKHAVVGFTRSVAAEVAQHGVTVNAICPGYLDTDMTQQSVDWIVTATGRTRDEALAAILETNPQRRLITPQEVATMVAFLCKESASSINGDAIVMDGGELRR